LLLLVLRIIYLIFLIAIGIQYTERFNKKDEDESKRIRYIWQTWTGDRGIWPAVEEVLKAIMFSLVMKYVHYIVSKEGKASLKSWLEAYGEVSNELSETMSKPALRRQDAFRSDSSMRELLEKVNARRA